MRRNCDRIVVFDQYINLRRTASGALMITVFMLFLSNIAITLDMAGGWLKLLPLIGVVSCIGFYILYKMAVNRISREQDDIMLVEVWGAFFTLLIGTVPTILYLMLDGNWDALQSWDYFVLYLTIENLLLPCALLFFVVYLYWMLTIQLYNGSELYYNCIKLKKDNE